MSPPSSSLFVVDVGICCIACLTARGAHAVSWSKDSRFASLPIFARSAPRAVAVDVARANARQIQNRSNHALATAWFRCKRRGWSPCPSQQAFAKRTHIPMGVP